MRNGKPLRHRFVSNLISCSWKMIIGQKRSRSKLIQVDAFVTWAIYNWLNNKRIYTRSERTRRRPYPFNSSNACSILGGMRYHACSPVYLWLRRKSSHRPVCIPGYSNSSSLKMELPSFVSVRISQFSWSTGMLTVSHMQPVKWSKLHEHTSHLKPSEECRD